MRLQVLSDYWKREGIFTQRIKHAVREWVLKDTPGNVHAQQPQLFAFVCIRLFAHISIEIIEIVLVKLPLWIAQ